jgi:hypothetical protein
MTDQKKGEREGVGTAETSHIVADPAPARRRRLMAARLLHHTKAPLELTAEA